MINENGLISTLANKTLPDQVIIDWMPQMVVEKLWIHHEIVFQHVSKAGNNL